MTPTKKAARAGKASAAKTTTVDELLSGKVSAGFAKRKKTRKKERPPELLPEQVKELSDILAAGRIAQKEMEFKVKFAEQGVKDYCQRRFVQIYIQSRKRPPSIDYASTHSRLKFVQTDRATLTPEKADELRELGIAIDEYTDLAGVRIDYEAVRHHKLERKLRQVLESIDASADVLQECFFPEVRISPVFFEMLDTLVRDSLEPGEKLEDKMLAVLRVINPASQIRNVEAPGLTAKQCFDLVLHAEIAPLDETGGEAA